MENIRPLSFHRMKLIGKKGVISWQKQILAKQLDRFIPDWKVCKEALYLAEEMIKQLKGE